MAQYSKVVNGDSVRYKDGGRFVKADDVPQNIKDALDQNPDGTIVDELGDVVDPSTETDEGSGDDDEVVTNAPQTEDDTTTADEADQDGAGDDGEDDEADEPEEAPAPKRRTRSSAKTEIGGMGYPAKNGKTLSIFSNKPHETVKNVGGHMVPLTQVELVGDPAKGIEPKTDTEIIERLKELGKI